MKQLLSCILVIGILAAAGQVLAFDGDRQGFMLNLGLGFGQAKETVSIGGVDASVKENGFGGDFKIGGGINSQTLLYYSNRTLFYSLDSYDVLGNPTTYDWVNGMSAAGVSYFLNPQAPSFFFSGAVGIGVLMDREAEENESGLGVTLGLGYEFATNWIIEVTYMTAKVAEELGADLTISNFMVSVSWLAY